MPHGFQITAIIGTKVNTYAQIQNCYYCTVAALLNLTTDKLVTKSETMQQDTANPDEIVALFKSAGISATYTANLSPAQVIAALAALPNGQSVGLAYSRPNGTGHMIVITKDSGYYNNNVNPGIKCVDYQSTIPHVTGFPPEPGALVYYLFYAV